MHTTSYWITLERSLLESLPFTVSERQSGMFGLLHALESVATLLLMCDRRDLGTAIGERPPAADSNSVPWGEGDELRSEEHTYELQSRLHLVCRLLLEKKNKYMYHSI